MNLYRSQIEQVMQQQVKVFHVCVSTSPGLSIDTAQWDLCHLPLRTSSVDIITTDMPFGKRYTYTI